MGHPPQEDDSWAGLSPAPTHDMKPSSMVHPGLWGGESWVGGDRAVRGFDGDGAGLAGGVGEEAAPGPVFGVCD